MKVSSFFPSKDVPSLKLFILCVTYLGISVVSDAEIKIDYSGAGDILATDYLRTETRSDPARAAFIKDRAIAGKLIQPFETSVSTGEKLIKLEVNPLYDSFPDIISFARVNPLSSLELKFNEESIELIKKFLQQSDSSDKVFPKFLQIEHADKGDFAVAVRSRLETARQIIRDGLPATSPQFELVLRLNTKLPARANAPVLMIERKYSHSVLSPQQKKNEDTENRNIETVKLWQEGVAVYKAMTRSQQELFIEENALDPLELKSASLKSGPSIPASGQVIQTVDNKFQSVQVAKAAELTKSDRMLMGLGLFDRKKRKATLMTAQNNKVKADTAKTEADSGSDMDKQKVAAKEVKLATAELKEATAAVKESYPLVKKKDTAGTSSGGVTTPIPATDQPTTTTAIDAAERLAAIGVYMPAQFGSRRDGVTRFLQFGVRKLSPYAVFDELDGQQKSTGKKYLGEAKDETTQFIEFIYSNKWAWNLERLESTKTNDEPPIPHSQSLIFAPGKYKEFRRTMGLSKADAWDWDFRFSYNLNSSKNASAQNGENGPNEDNDNEPNLSAEGITASSDIAIGLNLSRHLFRHRYNNGAAYAATLDFGYELASDRKVFDAHHRIFSGVGFSANFQVPGGGNRPALFATRLGYSRIENFVYANTGAGATDRLLLLDRGVPKFELDDSIAIEAELIYPLGSDSVITLTSRIHGKTDPNLWFVQIGYSRPISTFVGGLFDLGGDKQKPDPGLNPPEPTPTTKM